MIDKLTEKLPTSLRLSLSNLIEQFGDTDNILFGLLVNLTLAAPGVAVVLLVSNPILSMIGAAWAFINILPILSWVIGL